MTTRKRAKKWLRKNYPTETSNYLRTSKYFSDLKIWYFTFPTKFFEAGMEGYVNILCETRTDQDQFHYLKVPFSFFRENKDEFDIRESRDKFDLRISAKAGNWLTDERSISNVSFRPFEIT